MNGIDFPPLAVAKFSKTYLVDLIRLKTGWDQRNEVSSKTQLNYLCDYLSVDHIDAQTIVVENEYVDRHYLEDYSEYYARCFPAHPRMCSRIHFFSSSFDEQQFTKALANNDVDFQQQLNSSYIGFVVIRPIPDTFLAKLCIRPYEVLTNKTTGYQIIAKKTKVSLFGINLSVNCAPFAEQDRVVSVCATSALWALFSASEAFSFEKLPSPSAITKSAFKNRSDGTRVFPSTGLNSSQIAASLKHFGLEPLWLTCSESNFIGLRESIFAYISTGAPVLIGGSVYLKKDGVVTFIGNHLVCVLGYHIGNPSSKHQSRMKLLSHNIDKIYVHDDRHGPYLRLNTELTSFECLSKEGDHQILAGMQMSLTQNRCEYFIPDFALAGVEHKVRVPYEEINNICASLFTYLNFADPTIVSHLESPELTQDEDEYWSSVLLYLKNFTEAEWQITLTTNQVIREELLASNNFLSFNGVADKNALLLKSMPKHIWRCRISHHNELSESLQTDILFDATEIPQGKLMIGYIVYSDEAESLWQYIEVAVGDRDWQRYECHPDAQNYINTFLKFFSSHSERSFLNSIYGQLRLSLRNVKNGETDSQDNLSLRKDIFVIRRGATERTWDLLKKSIKYIWIIDSFGDFIFGEDYVSEDKTEVMGHPTLIDGKPARLGGELYFDQPLNRWVLNLKSQAYSSHIARDSEESVIRLDAVISHNLSGLDVTHLQNQH